MMITERVKDVPRIFIIDDSIAECLLMSNGLRQAGYNVGMATDGRGGLTTIMTNPPQCLILDVILSGMNGYAICRQIRALDPQHTIPIIMVSTKSTLLDQNYALRLGADRYLVKPFSLETLVQTVREMVAMPLPPPRPNVSNPITPLPPLPITDEVLQPPEQPAIQQLKTFASQTHLEGSTLIPYREREADILTVSSPFARSPLIEDKQSRRVYAAIDGQRTVQILSQMLQLDLHTTLKLLKTLWQQKRIAFYDNERHPLKELPPSLSEL